MTELTEEEWLFTLFKVFEGFICGFTFIIHIGGYFNRGEPIGHTTIYCGTYFGLFLVHNLEIILTLCEYTSSVNKEKLVTGSAVLLFLACSFLSMQQCEVDVHLPHISQIEEENHELFHWAKLQSILSLTGYSIHLMHLLLLLEYIKSKKNPPTGDEAPFFLKMLCVSSCGGFCKRRSAEGAGNAMCYIFIINNGSEASE